MAASRSGSAIIICVALASIAVVVGFAFIRGAGAQDSRGRSGMFTALAREAARSGIAHATENLVAAFEATEVEVATASGSALASPPPTFLHGPFRAPFLSHDRPDQLAYTQDDTYRGGRDGYDDVAEENHLLMTQTRHITEGDARYSFWHSRNGTQVYDCRGRYIELGYHDAPRSDIASTPPRALRFTDLSATPPGRTDGLFLDGQLRRMDPSIPVDERRSRARYRLRYAIGIEDLQGHLLSNPRGAMNVDWRDPHNDYRVQPVWLEQASAAWNNMVMFWGHGNGGPLSAAGRLRLGHVFRGRGSSTNADRAWAAGPRHGLPASFPLMFRGGSVQGGVGDHWGKFTYAGGYGTTGDKEGGRLFSFAGSSRWEPVAENPAGGEILTPFGQGHTWPYTHSLMGPQHSWFNQRMAVQGWITSSKSGDKIRDGHLAGSGLDIIKRNQDWFNTVPTPYGRRLEVSTLPRDEWKWYQGRVDTPWNVNLLTAPGEVIHEMLTAYLPPYLEDLQLQVGWYYGSNRTYLSHRPQMVRKDVHTALAGSGFSEFPPPESTARNGDTISPDWYQGDSRSPAERYPGPLVRGDPANAGEGEDDLGREIDAQAAGFGRCMHTGRPLVWPSGLGSRDMSQINDSYFMDMTYAMSQALGFARATWVQYPTIAFDPSSGFTPSSLRDPLAYDSLEEIDRLFLRQLGENYDAPGSACPDRPIVYISGRRVSRFELAAAPISNTIRSLVDNDLISTSTVTSIERGKVMERMLNDYRMSFLGSSPGYADFRPMDFDGDGQVVCSCYDPNPAATADEVSFRTARWKPAVAGVGPAPTPLTCIDPDTGRVDADVMARTGTNPYFSICGNFFIGKSRFYRIFTRGEVYDNMLRKPVAQQLVETVLCLDGEGLQVPTVNDHPGPSQILFQRWHHSEVSSELPHQRR